jgi:ATP-dependent DNA helicase RecQ
MTENARPILRDEKSIKLRRDTIRRAKITRRPEVKSLVSEEDAPLLSALKAKRRALAEEARVPAYIIFNDRTLIEMAQKRPNTLDDMANINGVGAVKLEKYGTDFIAVISKEIPPAQHPSRQKLAGKKEGTIYDRLLYAQGLLARGQDGTGKPMSCSASLLAKVVTVKPNNLQAIKRILGEKKTERFGPAFLEVINTLDK